MLLLDSGELLAADQIEEAIKFVTVKRLKSLAAGKMGYSTSEVGDLVIEAIRNRAQA